MLPSNFDNCSPIYSTRNLQFAIVGPHNMIFVTTLLVKTWIITFSSFKCDWSCDPRFYDMLQLCKYFLCFKKYAFCNIWFCISKLCWRSGLIMFNVHFSVLLNSFYPHDAMLARVFATATCPSICLSVCLSVCPSHAGIVPSRAKAGSWNVHLLIAPWF